MSRLLVVAVPAGAIVDGNAPLRALFVPQLQTDAKKPLSAFGFQDWPAVVDRAQFTLETATDPTDDPSSVPVTPLPGRSSDDWHGIFANLTVRPPRNHAYGELFVNPTGTDARNLVGNYRNSVDAYTGNTVDPTVAGAKVRAEYSQWTDIPPNGTPGDVAPQDWQTPDFQQTISMLREHPSVLIHLGLILEFFFPATVLGSAKLVRLGSTLDPQDLLGVDVVSPWTQFTVANRRFLPAKGPDGDVVGGMLSLTGVQKLTAKTMHAASATTMSLVTFDVNGGADRMREGAQKFAIDDTTTTPPDTGRTTLPVIHSAGISLVRHGRESVMKNRVGNAGVAMATRVLTADDLTAGYRVDVKYDGSDTWTPMLERKATYRINNSVMPVADDVEEGQVKANAAVIGDDLVLRADEVLLRWAGWNLAIPRPVFDQQGLRRNDTARVDVPFDFDYAFVQRADRPQTQLRFGQGYLLRVRAADMAGSGLQADDLTTDEGTSGVVIYRRYEPIPPPEFAPPPGLFTSEGGETSPHPEALGTGGTIDRLIIRSDPMGDVPMDVNQFAAAHPQYPPNSSRIVLPPPTSMGLAEQHGMLNGDDIGTWRLVQRAMNAPASAENGEYGWLPDPASTGVAAVIRNADDFAEGEDLDTRDLWSGNWPQQSPKTLQLLPPDPDDQRVIQWRAGTLAVRLEPGLQADLELTSTLNSLKLNEFEFNEWADDAATSQIVSGGNPMATPPRRVELVHAVRRPITAPAGIPTAERARDWTWVLITSDTRFGIHRPSTGQVDVTAEWHEVGDDETVGPLVTEAVTSLTVDPRADTLPDIRHEFNDTRHRVVAYTLSAVSRYRGLFDDADTANDADFCSSATLSDVIVLSTARPVPPVVLGVAPAFRRQAEVSPTGEVLRHRFAGRVRVEMARPWNLSGAGERLAVITAMADPPPSNTAAYLSRVYGDPIWNSPGETGYLPVTAFAGNVEPPAACLLAETDPRAQPPGSGPSNPQDGMAIPYATHLDEQTDRWYADVEIPGAASSYCPFVRLSLARYQFNSISSCELSRTVVTDFVQLLPDRTLTVNREDDALTLALDGPATGAGPTTNTVIAVLEECIVSPGTVSAPSDVTADVEIDGLWHRVPDAVVAGELAEVLTLAVPPSTGLLRVVVREIESITSPIPPADLGTLTADLQQRTVFLDVVPLDDLMRM